MFTKEDEIIIGRIMTLCMQDEKLKKLLESRYDSNPRILSVYEIYVLEEVFRYGNNGYYNSLIKHGNIKEVAHNYKIFMQNCEDMPELLFLKVKDYYRNSNSLDEFEKTCIKIILKDRDLKKELDNKMMYTYDDYVEIKLDTDDHIKEAIMNGLMMETLFTFIKNRIDKDTYDNMIKRQLKPGMFANVDKDYLINMLRDVPEVGEVIVETTNRLFNDIKADVENGNGLALLNNGLSGEVEDTKINISFADVYGNLIKNKHL